MLASLLIGLVAGQRAMTPPAVLALAARYGAFPPAVPAAALRRPAVVFGLVALAMAEMAGDKMVSAPDRTVPAGLAGRALTAAFTGGMLAPAKLARRGAAVATLAALASSFPGLALRRRSMRRFGRVPSGLAEDLVVVAGALLAVRLRRRSRRERFAV